MLLVALDIHQTQVAQTLQNQSTKPGGERWDPTDASVVREVLQEMHLPNPRMQVAEPY